jgi:hypothetical protein
MLQARVADSDIWRLITCVKIRYSKKNQKPVRLIWIYMLRRNTKSLSQNGLTQSWLEDGINIWLNHVEWTVGWPQAWVQCSCYRLSPQDCRDLHGLVPANSGTAKEHRWVLFRSCLSHQLFKTLFAVMKPESSLPVFKGRPLKSILSQLNQVHVFTALFF